MLLKISLIVAMCSGVTTAQVQSKLVDLRAKNPDAVVSYRIDNKAQCYKGQILTGKDAKLFEKLGK